MRIQVVVNNTSEHEQEAKHVNEFIGVEVAAEIRNGERWELRGVNGRKEIDLKERN
jgi:hypothetical protein